MTTIREDDRDIKSQCVRAKAESPDLVASGTTLSDQELLPMIFEPGFSTAAAVTNLCRRGVA